MYYKGFKMKNKIIEIKCREYSKYGNADKIIAGTY